MIISREADYAIRILRALADGEKHSTRELCEAECVPVKFGQKIVSKLQNQHLLRCERGKYGGILLDCDLKEASLYDVLEAIDEERHINSCLKKDHVCQWMETHDNACTVHQNLIAMQEQMDQTMKNLKLNSLMFQEVAN